MKLMCNGKTMAWLAAVASLILSRGAMAESTDSQNLVRNAYAPSWIATPYGHGQFVKDTEDPKVESLELKSAQAGAIFVLGNIPFQIDRKYELSVRIKAPEGTPYRFYVAYNGAGGQQVSGGEGVGDGEWQSQTKEFSFKDFPKGSNVEKGFVVISLDAPGELQVADVTIVKSEGKK